VDPVTQITFEDQGRRLSFREVFEGLRDIESFRALFIDSMREIKSSAYFFELPALTKSNIDRSFECVIVDGSALNKLVQDSKPFQKHFNGPDWVVAFSNLSGDAYLVAPVPRVCSQVYTHLASFVKGAPEKQVAEFWSVVAVEALGRLSDEPFWLSTAGLGVSWLHLRLDSRPKYYRYEPYKKLL